ncbi:MAG: hypothetical protein GF421_13185 [Candidatus Aminicenantes bacterium]|nr:hypothetical protein [Candidatus Aminicenantes bacterium]
MKGIIKDKKKKTPSRSPLFEKGDLIQDTSGAKRTSLLLGKYTIKEAGSVLRKKSFYREAKKRGLWPIDFDLDSSQYPPLQRLLIYYKHKDPDTIIVDLKIREGIFESQKDFPTEERISKFLVLEWLTLQNPRQEFGEQKTPLPGQKYPGLNLGKKVLDLFYYLARLNKDKGIIAYPAYFHNALLFSRYFDFMCPEKKAEVEAIKDTVEKITFKELAWIVHLNCLRDHQGNPYKWEAEEMVFPIDKRLKNYFSSKKYKREVKKAKEELKYFVDWDCFHKKSDRIRRSQSQNS